MISNNLKVGILIPTRNRADFVIRQIRYYASVDCPHTIYIGDSSDKEGAEKIKSEVDKLKNKINIVYEYLPALIGGSAGASKHLVSIAKEKYTCFTGDDDYHVPDSLIICAEFLENNPDYATASGHAVSFRVKGNGTYGDLERLGNYPVPDILDENAGKRLAHFFRYNFVTLFFVNRTEQLRKSHEYILKIKDRMLSDEIMPCSLAVIDGKSITLDCISFVKQIHDKHLVVLTPFQWLTTPEWHESYKIFEKVASENISKKDNISLESAAEITRQAYLAYLARLLVLETRPLPKDNPASNNGHSYKKMLRHARSKAVKAFPLLKYIYRIQIKPRLTGKRELHYEALQPESKYFKDIKPIIDSFTGITKI